MSENQGVIESFDQTDAVGSIRLADGRVVRFGRSACAFEPVVGAQVEVLGTTPGFRGALKATSLRLAEDRAAHASRLGARDTSLRGGHPPTLGADEFAATAREIGGLTVLFDEDVPREIGALLSWSLGFGFEKHGISVDVEGSSLVFFVKGAKVRALVGHDPYPASETDRTDVGSSFPMGKSALTLLFGFMPRAYFTQQPDAWLEAGHARAMSRLAKIFLTRGHAVIVHRAGELVAPAPRFLARLGDLDNPDDVPFAAWIDLRPTTDGEALSSVGLRAFGLPEVRVEGRCEPGTWASARRFEAALFACYCLCRCMWIEDGLFEVPRRIQIGSTRPELLGPVDVERWNAKAEGTGIDLSGNVSPIVLVLRHRDDSDDVAAMWAAASRAGAADPGKLGHGGYEALYLNALMTWLHLGQVRLISCLRERVPHRLVTLRGDGPHFMLTTSGIGRVAQPRGERAKGSDHIEIGAFVPAELAHEIAEVVLLVASLVHAPNEATVFEPWSLYVTGLATFLLRPWGPIAMGPGAPITLLELAPLDAGEIALAKQNPAARQAMLGPWDQAASARRWASNVPAFAGRS